MPRSRSIAFKLILVFTLCSALIFSVTLGYNYYQSRMMLEKELEGNARNLALSLVNRVETVLASVGEATEEMALSLEIGRYGERELLALLRGTVERNDHIYGSVAAFEPDVFCVATRLYAPYFHKEKGGILLTRLERSHSYLFRDWYQIPRELEKPGWSEPYIDQEKGNILMTSYSVPFFENRDGKRRLRGVVASDVSLSALTELVSSIKVLKTGYCTLSSRNGTILTHPVKKLIMNETFFTIAEARNDAGLREIGRKMIRGDSGFVPFKTLTGVKSWLYYAPIPSTGWTLSVMFPEAELLENVRTLSMTVAVMGLVGILLLAVVVVILARSITTPLHALAAATEVIAAGNFEVNLPPVRSHDEVGILSDAFLVMKESLKDHMKRLTETTVAKERIESELKIAHDIQMGILPKIFPPFPDREEFDIYALIEPAREVGGDFYDFFQIDDTHLCFVIADVSGKGVPASLFMAVTKTLIKATARKGITPDKILCQVNDELSSDNETCMFVSIFCGILDTSNGELLYANGGHNLPLLVQPGSGVSFFPKGGGLVVGAMEGSVYRCDRMLLAPGESLFLYTDGVTEAMNLRDEQFSEARLAQELTALRGRPLQEMVKVIMGNIRNFAGDAPQSDDITMLLVQYRGDNSNHFLAASP